MARPDARGRADDNGCPGEGAFNDPSFRQDDEAVLVAVAHDLQLPHARVGDDSRLIARVADDANGKLHRASRSSASAPSRSWMLAGMHADGQQQAERIIRMWRLRLSTFLPAS